MRNSHGRGRAAALVGAVAATLVLTTASPASAETVRIVDRAGDGIRHAGDPQRSSHGDIGRVRVDHRLRTVEVRLFAAPAPAHFEEFTEVWIDTRPRNRGPERVLTFGAEVERWWVNKVDRFSRDGNGFGPQTCSGSAPFLPRRLVAVVPRHCLGFPPKVRVCVRTAAEGFEVRFDWAPGRHRFSRWVQRG